MKSAIELQKRKVQRKRNEIAELDENCIYIEEQAAAVKRNIHRFIEHFRRAVIEAKEKEIFNKVDIQVKESHERLQTELRDLDKQAKLIEIGIGKTKHF